MHQNQGHSMTLKNIDMRKGDVDYKMNSDGIKRRTYPKNPDYDFDAELSDTYFRPLNNLSRYKNGDSI